MRIFLATLGLDVDLMGSQVDDVKRMKPPVSFDISGTYKVSLMNLISPENLFEIGIINPFRNIRSFF